MKFIPNSHARRAAVSLRFAGMSKSASTNFGCCEPESLQSRHLVPLPEGRRDKVGGERHLETT